MSVPRSLGPSAAWSFPAAFHSSAVAFQVAAPLDSMLQFAYVLLERAQHAAFGPGLQAGHCLGQGLLASPLGENSPQKCAQEGEGTRPSCHDCLQRTWLVWQEAPRTRHVDHSLLLAVSGVLAPTRCEPRGSVVQAEGGYFW